MEEGVPEPPDAQPAPAGDDELREAEEWARHLVDHGVVGHWTTRLMAEYDERGRELERLRRIERAAAAVRDSQPDSSPAHQIALIILGEIR